MALKTRSQTAAARESQKLKCNDNVDQQSKGFRKSKASKNQRQSSHAVDNNSDVEYISSSMIQKCPKNISYYDRLINNCDSEWLGVDKQKKITISEFSQSPGIRISSDICYEPVDIFNMIFENIMEIIIAETNYYAHYIKKYPNWINVTESELRTFFGLMITTSYHKIPRLEDIWHTHWALGMPQVARIMTKERFFQILCHLHFSRNTYSNEKVDKVYKIRPIIDHFTNKFQSLYQPHREMSIGHSLTLNHRDNNWELDSSKMKPFLWWVLADSHNGYIYNMNLFPSRDGTDNLPLHVKNQIVCSLVLPCLAFKRHIIFTNEFHSSIDLLSELIKSEVYCCGKINEKYAPNQLINSSQKNNFLHFVMHRNIDLQLLSWKDKKEMYFINNAYPPTEIVKNDKKLCPLAVSEYDRYCQGVKQANRKREMFTVHRKMDRWPLYLFWHCFDTAICNANIIYNEYLEDKCKKKICELEFRISLVEGLVNITSKEKEKLGNSKITKPIEYVRNLKIGIKGKMYKTETGKVNIIKQNNEQKLEKIRQQDIEQIKVNVKRQLEKEIQKLKNETKRQKMALIKSQIEIVKIKHLINRNQNQIFKAKVKLEEVNISEKNNIKVKVQKQKKDIEAQSKDKPRLEKKTKIGDEIEISYQDKEMKILERDEKLIQKNKEKKNESTDSVLQHENIDMNKHGLKYPKPCVVCLEKNIARFTVFGCLACDMLSFCRPPENCFKIYHHPANSEFPIVHQQANSNPSEISELTSQKGEEMMDTQPGNLENSETTTQWTKETLVVQLVNEDGNLVQENNGNVYLDKEPHNKSQAKKTIKRKLPPCSSDIPSASLSVSNTLPANYQENVINEPTWQVGPATITLLQHHSGNIIPDTALSPSDIMANHQEPNSNAFGSLITSISGNIVRSSQRLKIMKQLKADNKDNSDNSTACQSDKTATRTKQSISKDNVNNKNSDNTITSQSFSKSLLKSNTVTKTKQSISKNDVTTNKIGFTFNGSTSVVTNQSEGSSNSSVMTCQSSFSKNDDTRNLAIQSTSDNSIAVESSSISDTSYMTSKNTPHSPSNMKILSVIGKYTPHLITKPASNSDVMSQFPSYSIVPFTIAESASSNKMSFMNVKWISKKSIPDKKSESIPNTTIKSSQSVSNVAISAVKSTSISNMTNRSILKKNIFKNNVSNTTNYSTSSNNIAVKSPGPVSDSNAFIVANQSTFGNDVANTSFGSALNSDVTIQKFSNVNNHVQEMIDFKAMDSMFENNTSFVMNPSTLDNNVVGVSDDSAPDSNTPILTIQSVIGKYTPHLDIDSACNGKTIIVRKQSESDILVTTNRSTCASNTPIIPIQDSLSVRDDSIYRYTCNYETPILSNEFTYDSDVIGSTPETNKPIMSIQSLSDKYRSQMTVESLSNNRKSSIATLSPNNNFSNRTVETPLDNNTLIIESDHSYCRKRSDIPNQSPSDSDFVIMEIETSPNSSQAQHSTTDDAASFRTVKSKFVENMFIMTSELSSTTVDQC